MDTLHESISFPGTGLGRNVIIFGVDMSWVHQQKLIAGKYILILGKGPTQWLETQFYSDLKEILFKPAL